MFLHLFVILFTVSTEVGGMHPTGMHSCFILKLLLVGLASTAVPSDWSGMFGVAGSVASRTSGFDVASGCTSVSHIVW